MSDREKARREARADVAANPRLSTRHFDAIRIYLGGVSYPETRRAAGAARKTAKRESENPTEDGENDTAGDA